MIFPGDSSLDSSSRTRAALAEPSLSLPSGIILSPLQTTPRLSAAVTSYPYEHHRSPGHTLLSLFPAPGGLFSRCRGGSERQRCQWKWVRGTGSYFSACENTEFQSREGMFSHRRIGVASTRHSKVQKSLSVINCKGLPVVSGFKFGFRREYQPNPLQRANDFIWVLPVQTEMTNKKRNQQLQIE